MKYFLNKTNIFLIVLLFLLVGLLIGTLVYFSNDSTEEELVIPTETATTEMKEEEVLFELPAVSDDLKREDMEEFFNANGFKDTSFEYEISAKEKDTVLKINRDGKVSPDALIVVTLSAGQESNDIEVSVPDFSLYSLSEVEAWAKSNSISLQISYNVSDSVERGKILSQSPAKNTNVKTGNQVKIVVSDGKGISIIDINNLTKSDIEKWVKENALEKVTYQYQYSDSLKKDEIISIKPKSGVIISSDYPVTVVVSNGVQAEVKSGYEGKTLNEFEKYIASLNADLKLMDSKNRYYSNVYDKDTVYSYDSGKKENGDVIQYALSLGKFVLNPSEFEGLTRNKANELIASYEKKNATISVEYTEEKTSDSSKIGITYDCSGKNSKLSCKIGIKSIPDIDVNEYNGLSETDAKNKMTTYSKTYNVGTIYFSYGDMSKTDKGKTYGCSLKENYSVSCNLYREYFDADTFNGKTRNEVEQYISLYNSTYGKSYTVKFNETESDSVASGKVFDTTISENKITCKLSTGISMADIMEPDAYSYCVGSSYDATKNALSEIFQPFVNVTYKGVSANRSEGQIVHISVNGVKDSYTGGKYPTKTTVIVIEICNNDTK